MKSVPTDPEAAFVICNSALAARGYSATEAAHLICQAYCSDAVEDVLDQEFMHQTLAEREARDSDAN